MEMFGFSPPDDTRGLDTVTLLTPPPPLPHGLLGSAAVTCPVISSAPPPPVTGTWTMNPPGEGLPGQEKVNEKVQVEGVGQICAVSASRVEK